MDVERRTCEVSAFYDDNEVNLTMHFPDNYPNNSVPTFTFGRDSTFDDGTRSRLVKVSLVSVVWL